MRPIHKIVLFAWALSALSACQEDSLTQGNETDRSELEISARIVQESQTRVNDGGFVDQDAIGLYVADYANGAPKPLLPQGNHATNVKFTYGESTASWTGSSTIYWTDSETPVDAYSYYPFRELIDNPTNMEISVSPRQDKQEENALMGNYEKSDFLWAKAEKAMPGKVIELKYCHLLAGVEINLLRGTGFSDTDWADVEKNVIIKDVKTQATVDLSTGSVSPADKKETVIPYPKGNTYRAVIVPQDIDAGHTLFSITIGGVSYAFTRDTQMQFMGRKLHKFTIEVIQRMEKGDYEFKLADQSVTAWTDDGISHNGTAREYVVMHSPAKGKLGEILEASGRNLDQLLNLKVTGEMNAKDFTYLREKLPNLEAIHLKEVKLKDCAFGNWQNGNETPEEDVIPHQAFYCCTHLKYIVFPDKLKKIGSYAFRGAGLCGALDIPEGVTHIGNDAFSNWESYEGAHLFLTSLSLPTTLEYIGSNAFWDNKFNCELILPESLTYIGDNAFGGCTYMYGQYRLPSKLETLGSNAFAGLSRVTGTLTFPAGTQKIGSGFGDLGCSRLYLPDGLEVISNGAFGGSHYGRKLRLTGDLYIPNTVTEIGEEAFCNQQFSHIHLPEKLTELSAGILSGCDKLIDTLKIPETVTQIREKAFNDCSSLTAIILPENLQYIYSGAFNGCSSLNLLRCLSKDPPIVQGDVFGSLPKDNFTVEVPEGSVDSYRNAEGWKEFKRISAYQNLVCRPQFANLLNKGSQRKVILNADGDWEMTYCPSWCSVSPNQGHKKTELTITIEDLPQGNATREDTIVFSLKGTEYKTSYYVKQYDSTYKEDEVHDIQTARNGKGINLIIIGDGYDAKDIAEETYLTDMKQCMEYFLGVEPYKTYRDYFNVSTIWAMSYESGIGTLNTLRDTKFDTQFGNGTYNSRISCNVEYAMQYVTEHDEKITAENLKDALIIMVPNSGMYDGICYLYEDGSALALCPKSEAEYPFDARGVVQHEACGHGFAKLADEYIYHRAWIQTCKCICCDHADGLTNMQSKGWGQNLSLKGSYKEVPWRHMMEDARFNDIVDIYDGGYFHSNGVYRPETNSVMNNNVPYLNSWSREIAVRRIKQLAGETFDYADFAAKDSREWGRDFTISSQSRYHIPGRDAFGCRPTAHPVIINRKPNLHTRKK